MILNLSQKQEVIKITNKGYFLHYSDEGLSMKGCVCSRNTDLYSSFSEKIFSFVSALRKPTFCSSSLSLSVSLSHHVPFLSLSLNLSLKHTHNYRDKMCAFNANLCLYSEYSNLFLSLSLSLSHTHTHTHTDDRDVLNNLSLSHSLS